MVGVGSDGIKHLPSWPPTKSWTLPSTSAHFKQEEVLGLNVRISGFIQLASFNGMAAYVESETGDGRFDLRLQNGTLLRWVKRENFDSVNAVSLTAPYLRLAA